MNSYAEKISEQPKAIADNATRSSIVNNRPEAQSMRSLQNSGSSSAQVQQLKAYQTMADQATVQRQANTTGMPDNLKSGIENLSGYSMNDVKVHYNSDKPAQLNAHAYAQGTQIHLASGQEKHLPHEAWHVVQQKQGRVKPTIQLQGKIDINDNAGLEHEADIMGAKALQLKHTNPIVNTTSGQLQDDIVQRKIKVAKEEYTMYGFEIPESLYKALLAKQCLPTAQVIDILSRYDFQNKSFANLDKLIESINEEVKAEGVSHPHLSPQQMLRTIVNPRDPMDVEVILARGLHSIQQRDNIISNRSAGGESMDTNASPPSEESAINQVETEVVPWAVKDTSVLHKSDLAEFTTNYVLANGFGKTRGGTLVIKISAKYLREGSRSESGWVALKSAPIKVVAYIPKGK